jgi:hypothetical protein
MGRALITGILARLHKASGPAASAGLRTSKSKNIGQWI